MIFQGEKLIVDAAHFSLKRKREMMQRRVNVKIRHVFSETLCEYKENL